MAGECVKYVLGLLTDRCWFVSRKEHIQIRLKEAFWSVLNDANAVAFCCWQVHGDFV